MPKKTEPKTTKAKKTAQSEYSINVIDTDQKALDAIDLKSFYTEAELQQGFKPKFIHQILHTYLGNSRSGSSKVKDRSEVKGGGRKPWRQKGTGRARQGSIRSPLWRGGGITFGPTGQENYSRKLTKKMRNKALRYGLLAMQTNNNLVVLDSYPEIKTTREFAAFAKKLSLATRTILLINDKTLPYSVIAGNLDIVYPVLVSQLNPLQIFKADKLVGTREDIENLLKRIKA